MTATNLEALDWAAIGGDLDAYGCAVAPKLLSPETRRALAALYPDDARFRSTIVMARHGFGRDEYKYFAEPLPDFVAALRQNLYPRLAPIANRWNETMGVDACYPVEHDAFGGRMTRRRIDAPDAAPPALSNRRLQLPASGRLWRGRFAAPNRDPALSAGARF